MRELVKHLSVGCAAILAVVALASPGFPYARLYLAALVTLLVIGGLRDGVRSLARRRSR